MRSCSGGSIMIKRPVKAVIFGCSGLTLTPAEKAFFKESNPLGLILFKRNISAPDQVRKLVSSFRRCVGRKNAPVLIDQEGGRVQRLRAPYWTELPTADTYGKVYSDSPKKAVAAVKKHAKILAKELLDLGINTDCWPCLDLEIKKSNVMETRCYSDNPEIVAELAQVAIDTALNQGLMPIAKHFPGYGRTTIDPHKGLPTVKTPLATLKKTDFYPFRQVQQAIWGMTAHVIYTALDKEVPATLSKTVIDYIRNDIGFDGFLICDDMMMGALAQYGTPRQIARKILKAGCDAVLHCNGILSDMEKLSPHIPDLTDQAQKRLKAAEALL